MQTSVSSKELDKPVSKIRRTRIRWRASSIMLPIARLSNIRLTERRLRAIGKLAPRSPRRLRQITQPRIPGLQIASRSSSRRSSYPHLPHEVFMGRGIFYGWSITVRIRRRVFHVERSAPYRAPSLQPSRKRRLLCFQVRVQ
jgi:hypothetical protein